jgi:hypothetical protein
MLQPLTMQNAMILAIHYLGSSPSNRKSYREWATRYADLFCAYLERHNTLLFAMRDPDVSLDAFVQMNDEIRANALELKKLRIELRIYEVRSEISQGPFVQPENGVVGAGDGSPDQGSGQDGEQNTWAQPPDGSALSPEDV